MIWLNIEGLSWSWSYVSGFTTTCAISREFESCSWRGVLDTTLCDKVCQWLAAGWWFSFVLQFPPPIKLPNVNEIFLKVALNTISQSNQTRGQNLAFLLQLPTELPGKYFQCPSLNIGSPAAYVLHEMFNISVAILAATWKIWRTR